MKNLFSESWYRKLIKNNQEVMIGYSDSSKDAGKICASWHQYKAQEEIVGLANKYKIDVTFFHGRGGSAGRGGGPIQATLRSQPPNSVNGKIRITDQGEVIQQKYGYEPLAKYNLCSYIGAVAEATLNPPPKPKNNWRSLIEKMSDISKSSYRKNINQSTEFIKYFKNVLNLIIVLFLFHFQICNRSLKGLCCNLCQNKEEDCQTLSQCPEIQMKLNLLESHELNHSESITVFNQLQSKVCLQNESQKKFCC